MARSRRGGGSSLRRPAPSAAARRPVTTRAAPPKQTPAPTPAAQPPAVQQSSGGGMLGSIGSTIAQGMAFGTGSAIAHRAVGAVADSFSGGASAEAPEYAAGAMPPPQQTADACGMDKTNFYDCLQHNKGDEQACQFLFEQLKSCQQMQQFQ